GDIWVGVHFGSRGFGHTVASGFLALSQGKKWGERVPEAETLLPLAQPLGHDYWHLMTLAGEYAYAGREWVARKVTSLLGGEEVVLRGGGLDESPHAYRRLPDVLAAQGDTVTVLHTLTPLIVVMAGEKEFDPYKD